MTQSKRASRRVDLFDFMIFFFFLTLHADQLAFSFGGFNFRINNLISLFLLVILCLRFPRIHLNRTFIYLILSFSFSLFLSFLFSSFKERSLFFLFWHCFTMLCYVVLPYLLMQNLSSEKILRLYFLSFLVVGFYGFWQLAASTVGIIDPFVTQRFGRGIRPNALTYEPSYFALYMTPFVMMVNVQALLRPKEPFFLFSSLNWKIVGLVNFLYLLSTSTATIFAYIIFICFVCSYALYSKNTKLFSSLIRFVSISVILFCGAVKALPFLMKNFFLKFFHVGFTAHHSFHERWIGICNSWEIFKENPFTGIGMGAIPPYLFQAFLKGDSRFQFSFSKFFYLVEKNNPLKMFEPTCASLELLASLGIIGFTTFIFLMVHVFYKILRSHSPYRIAFLISFVMMLIVLQFSQGIFRTYIWTHLALIYAFSEKITITRNAIDAIEV